MKAHALLITAVGMADSYKGATDMPQHTTSNFKRPLRACVYCGKQFQPLNDAKRYCSKRCYGDAITRPPAERFWSHVQKTDACWIWTGGRSCQDYGRMSGNNRMIPAHRFSWELHNGPIPDGLFVCHRCDNPPCVNPDHLFLGTMTDNMRDMAAKGRQVFQKHPERAPCGDRNGSHTCPETRPRGESHYAAKLTETDVRMIRALRGNGRSVVSLAQQFGVATATIKNIVNRKRWKHI